MTHLEYSLIITFFISLVSFTPVIKQAEVKPVIFNATADNPNGINLGLDHTYIPRKRNVILRRQPKNPFKTVCDPFQDPSLRSG